MDSQSDAMYAAMARAQMQPSPEALAAASLLENVYPALKRKIFAEGDDLVKHFVTTQYNPISLMNMPLCGHCESFAYRYESGYKDGKRVETCMCRKCGRRTFAPIHFGDWLAEEIRGRVPKGMEKSVTRDLVDAHAMIHVTRGVMDYLRLKKKLNVERNDEMGVSSVGTPTNEATSMSRMKVRELSPEEVEARQDELDAYFKKEVKTDG